MRLAGLWAACALICCCCGCGGGNSSPTNVGTNQNPIVGRWAADTIQGPGGVAQSCPAAIDVGVNTYACGLNDTQVFRADGSYDESSGAQRGTWTANGGSLTVTLNGQSPRTLSYSVLENVLTEQAPTGSGPITIKFHRQ